MKLTKLIYLASPYSHKGEFIRNMRYNLITKITGKLQDRYPYAFIGPITQSHNTAPYMESPNTEFTSWAIRDLTYISRSDEMWVVMIDGWKESKGVQAEIEFASNQNIKVRYINPETLIFKRMR